MISSYENIMFDPRRMGGSISRIRKSKKVAHYVSFDVETVPVHYPRGKERHVFRLACAQEMTLFASVHAQKYPVRTFFTLEDLHMFILSVMRRHGNIILLAHNMNFDFVAGGMFSFLTEHGMKLKVFNPKRKSFLMVAVGNGYSLTFVDSLNYFHSSLERLGKDIGLRKGKMPEFNDSDRKWQAYCTRDVEIVTEAYTMLSKFLSKYGEGTVPATLAMCAFRIFRKKFMDISIVRHSDSDATQIETEAYRGGNVQMFFYGKLPRKRYTMYDFNSLYPHVMRNMEYPVRMLKVLKDPSVSAINAYLKYNCVIARCVVDIKDASIGKRIGPRLVFPNGRFAVTLTTGELEHAIKCDSLLRISDAVIYSKAKIFDGYVNHFYKAKEKYSRKNNDTFRYFSKLMLNTLYGKFGQRIDMTTPTGEKSSEAYNIREVLMGNGHRNYHEKIINHDIYREDRQVIGVNTVMSIAAEVTANARMALNHAIEMAGRENVFYVDTDSLIVNETGKKRLAGLADDFKLGFLKKETSSCDLTINGLKNYSFGKKKVLKGVPKKSRKISDTEFEYESFNGVVSSLRDSALDSVIVKVISKSTPSGVSKGVLCPDGRVKPIVLHEDV